MDREKKPNNTLRVGLIFAVSLAVGVALLAFFLHLVGFGQIVETIRRVDIRLVLLAFVLDMLGLFLYGSCWYVLLRAAGLNIPFPTCMSIALAGIFTCYITPSGFFMDASRVLLASKESDIRVGDGAATVILHKILFTLGFVTFGLLATAMLLVTRGLPQPLAVNVFAITTFVVVGIIGVALVIVRGHRIRQYFPGLVRRVVSTLNSLSGKYYPALSSSVKGITRDFRETFVRLLRSPTAILVSYLLSLSYWTTSVLILYVVFVALGQNVSIWVIMLTISIGDFIQMTPIAIPGMLGVIEMVTTTVLVAFGIPLGVAASATLLARVATFWFDLPITGAAASYYGAKYVIGLASNISGSSD